MQTLAACTFFSPSQTISGKFETKGEAINTVWILTENDMKQYLQDVRPVVAQAAETRAREIAALRDEYQRQLDYIAAATDQYAQLKADFQNAKAQIEEKELAIENINRPETPEIDPADQILGRVTPPPANRSATNTAILKRTNELKNEIEKLRLQSRVYEKQMNILRDNLDARTARAETDGERLRQREANLATLETPADYFAGHFPNPLAVRNADATGAFQITVPTNQKVALIARSIADRAQNGRYWMIWIEPDQGKNIVLDSTNEMGSNNKNAIVKLN